MDWLNPHNYKQGKRGKWLIEKKSWQGWAHSKLMSSLETWDSGMAIDHSLIGRLG